MKKKLLEQVMLSITTLIITALVGFFIQMIFEDKGMIEVGNLVESKNSYSVGLNISVTAGV